MRFAVVDRGLLVLDGRLALGEELVAAMLAFGAAVAALWPSDRSRKSAPVLRPNRFVRLRKHIWVGSIPVGLALATSDMLTGLTIVAAGPVGWWFTRRRQIEGVKRARREAVPETLDLISIAVGSGASTTGAIELVYAEGPLAVRSGFGAVLTRSASGLPLARALPALSDDLGEAYHPLVMALMSSVRDGAPLGQLLGRLGDNARLSRRRRAEERARQLPVAMMFPLALCSMPAVLIGTMVPLVIVGFRSTSF